MSVRAVGEGSGRACINWRPSAKQDARHGVGLGGAASSAQDYDFVRPCAGLSTVCAQCVPNLWISWRSNWNRQAASGLESTAICILLGVIGVPASCADYLPGRCEVWGDVGQLGVWRVWLMDALRDQDAPKLAHKSYISWECDQVSSLVVRGWHASA